MGKIVKYCKKCFNEPEKYTSDMLRITGMSFDDIQKYFTIGYFSPDRDNDKEFCTYHPEEKLCFSKLSYEEYDILSFISSDFQFMQAMENLKETDIIEFNLKMSQFTTQLGQQQNNEIQNDSRPKCPTCNSINIEKISIGKKAFGGVMFGLLSSDVRKTMHCNNCGYKW